MKVNVLIFGPLRDITGASICRIDDVNDTDEMIGKMNSLFPELKKRKYLIAVQKEIIQRNTELYDDYTVALLPPYSGG